MFQVLLFIGLQGYFVAGLLVDAPTDEGEGALAELHTDLEIVEGEKLRY